MISSNSGAVTLKSSEPTNLQRWLLWIEKTILISVIAFGYAMLIMGAYHCYPNAEDYEVSCASRDIGVIHSILEVMTNYDGRYTTNILHAINPLAFNWIRGYSIMNLAGVILLNLSIYFLMRVITKPQSSFTTFLYSGFITVVYMGCILCFATFYQMTGNFVYIYPNSFALLFGGSLLLYLQAKKPLSESIFFVITALILVAAIGFSEPYLPFYSLLLTCLLVYIWYVDKQLLSRFVPIFIVGWLSVLFFVTTPGIQLHMEGPNINNSQGLIFSVILNCLRNYGEALSATIQKPIFFCSLIYFIILFHEKRIEHKFNIKRKILLLLMMLTVGITLLMTATYYLPKMDSLGYPLKIYTPVLFLLLVATYLLFCSAIILPTSLSNHYLLAAVKTTVLTIVLINFIWGDNYIACLYDDYRNNKLQTFKAFMDNRIETLSKASELRSNYKCAYVPALIDCPRSVYISIDSETNRTASKWNKYHEEYFKLDEVSIIGDTTFRFY